MDVNGFAAAFSSISIIYREAISLQRRHAPDEQRAHIIHGRLGDATNLVQVTIDVLLRQQTQEEQTNILSGLRQLLASLQSVQTSISPIIAGDEDDETYPYHFECPRELQETAGRPR